jgi:hypothetical protein
VRFGRASISSHLAATSGIARTTKHSLGGEIHNDLSSCAYRDDSAASPESAKDAVQHFSCRLLEREAPEVAAKFPSKSKAIAPTVPGGEAKSSATRAHRVDSSCRCRSSVLKYSFGTQGVVLDNPAAFQHCGHTFPTPAMMKPRREF